MASMSILDILHQIPTLSDFLTPDAQKALSATCRICRLRFIAQVQVVTVVHKEDYALVFGRRWPQLSMVILQGDSAVPQHSNLTRIINLYISAEGNSQATISMLRPLHNRATDLPCTHSAAQQLAHQMRVRWPLMTSFAMFHMHDLDGLGHEIVSQLVKGTWTQLEYLHLSECDLNAEGFLILSQGNWPGLRNLDVSGSCLDATGMASLVKGNWVELTRIALSFHPTLDAAAIAHLSTARWQIGKLVVQDTPFSIDMAAELADLQLPNLSVLHLMGSGLTAAAVSELARANWPGLSNLCVDHDDLDAVAVLLGVDQEKVQKLKSGVCDFAVSEQRMSVGLWPNISWIRISKNNLHLSAR